MKKQAPVAQLDRALPSEGKGREFESRQAHQFDFSSHFCILFGISGMRQFVSFDNLEGYFPGQSESLKFEKYSNPSVFGNPRTKLF